MKPNHHLLPLLISASIFTACAPALDAPIPPPAPAPAPVVVEMVVVAPKALNVRSEPSEKAAVVRELRNGDVVVVSAIRVVGESRWCRHADGWSNCRWLRVTE